MKTETMLRMWTAISIASAGFVNADTLWRRRVVQVSPGDIESIVVVT
jgi:hypothetical protein